MKKKKKKKEACNYLEILLCLFLQVSLCFDELTLRDSYPGRNVHCCSSNPLNRKNEIEWLKHIVFHESSISTFFSPVVSFFFLFYSLLFYVKFM